MKELFNYNYIVTCANLICISVVFFKTKTCSSLSEKEGKKHTFLETSLKNFKVRDMPNKILYFHSSN